MIKHSAKENRNQRESTETEQKLEKKEESLYRDGEGEPNEIQRHTLTELRARILRNTVHKSPTHYVGTMRARTP